MNHHIRKIFLAAIGLFCAARGFAAPAEFLNLDPGARPTGLGSAFTALADDDNTQLFNPAGIANLGPGAFQATGSYGFLSLDRHQDDLAASQELEPNGYLGFYADHFQVDTIDGRNPDGFATSSLQDLELAFGATYAYDFGYDLKAGIGASFLYQDLAATIAKGFGGVDLGFLYIPSPLYDFTLGASLRHLGGFLTWDTGTMDTLNPDLRLGASLKMLGQAVALAYDAEWSMDGTFVILHHVGAEVYPWPFIGLRGGLDDANPVFGAAVKILDYEFDYAFEFQPAALGNIQRVGLDFTL